MREHPRPEVLNRFMRGELTREQTREVLVHLLRGCRFCQAAVAPMAQAMFSKDLPEKPGDTGEVYEPAFERAVPVIERAAARAVEEPRLVDEAYRALVSEGFSGVNGASGRDFQPLVLCLALLRRSGELRHENPVEMLRLAHLAALAAQRLDAEEVGAERVADLQAHTLAELGDARRTTGDLDGAERTLERALQALENGSQNPLLCAHVLSTGATLFAGQRRFAAALQLLETVEAMYGELQEHDHLARALLQRGTYTGYLGDATAAVDLLRRAVEEINEAADPQLALAAVHNLAWFLMEKGDYREARRVVWTNRVLYSRHADPELLIQHAWLRGKIAAGLGELHPAARDLAEAMHDFEAAGLGYEQALAALDLAAVWIRLGRPEAAGELIEQAADAFATIGILQEAVPVLRILRAVCERELVPAAFVQDVSTFFRRLAHDPSARFQE